MAAARYAYIGGAEMWYQQYRDPDTDRMLIAQPDHSYSMVPVDPDAPVPPNDGRWSAAIWPVPPPVSPAPAPQPVTAPAPAPAPAPEGGDE